MVAVLDRLGAQRVMTVHSAGLDEISIDQPTLIVELIDGETRDFEVTPEALDIRRRGIEDLACDSVEQSLQLVQRSLTEPDSSAADIVAVNAGAAIYVAGIAASLGDGVAQARARIKDGAALDRFKRLASLSQELSRNST